MKLTGTRLLALILVGSVSFMVATAAFSSEWKVPAEWKFITFAGGSAAGSWTPLTAKISELINQQIPGVNAKSTLGATYRNLIGLDQGKVQMGMSLGSAVAETYHNIDIGGVKKFKPSKKIRHLASMHYGVYYVYVPKNGPIKHISEMAKKPIRTAVGSVGSITYAFNNLLLKYYGSSIEDLEARGGTAHKLLYGEGVKMMKDGKVDLLAHNTGPYASMIMDAATSPGIRFLDYDPDLKKWLKSKLYGTADIVNPKDMYPGIEKDYHTLAVYYPIIVNREMPEELAYRITKVIWENLKKVQSIGAFGKFIQWKTALAGNTIPIHPGAERYYREKGMTIPALPKMSK